MLEPEAPTGPDEPLELLDDPDEPDELEDPPPPDDEPDEVAVPLVPLVRGTACPATDGTAIPTATRKVSVRIDLVMACSPGVGTLNLTVFAASLRPPTRPCK